MYLLAIADDGEQGRRTYEGNRGGRGEDWTCPLQLGQQMRGDRPEMYPIVLPILP